MAAKAWFVDVSGDDRHPGTFEKPFQTLGKALAVCAGAGPGNRTVSLRGGTHGLEQSLLIGPGLSGLTLKAFGDERVSISGGRRLDCRWQPYRDGIYVCDLPEAKAGAMAFTQMFADGKRQIRARFPNRDDSRPDKRGGYIHPSDVLKTAEGDPAPDRDADMTYDCEPFKGIVFDPATFTKRSWARPSDAVIHIFHDAYWGNLQWHTVERVTFNRLHFTLTETTLFEPYEVPSLGDWALHRGGALRLEGTRDCTVRDCLFSGLGGNALFANGFNRDLEVTGCTFR